MTIDELTIIIDFLTDAIAELDHVPSARTVSVEFWLQLQRRQLNKALLELDTQKDEE